MAFFSYFVFIIFREHKTLATVITDYGGVSEKKNIRYVITVARVLLYSRKIMKTK